MTDHSQLEREIREIVVIAGASEATDEQLDRLNQLVAEDSEMQQYVCLLLQQIGNIRWGAQQNVAATLRAFGAISPEECTSSPALLDPLAEGEVSDFFSTPPLEASSRFENRIPPLVVFGSLAVIAAMSCWLLVGAWLWPQNNGEVVQNQTSHDPQSADGTIRHLGVGAIRIDSGTASLRLPNVGYLVVDGPAEMELITPMRMRLDLGRIRIRVTEPTGYGFTVVTPHGEVVDLGTEFGIEVSDVNATELVVFDGAVDLHMPGASATQPSVERLIGGEGIRFERNGHFDRIMSINTGHVATFQRSNASSASGKSPVILHVSDNLRTKETKRFYEIVHGGLDEDVTSYVDRPYEWNGVDRSGMPEFLIGADYVKTFNSYKRRSFQIRVKLAKPSHLYLFWDDLVPAADWLTEDFVDTGLDIGMDEERYPPFRKNQGVLGRGPGTEVDKTFSVWRRRDIASGEIQLGPVSRKQQFISMYGFAAVPASGHSSHLPKDGE